MDEVRSLTRDLVSVPSHDGEREAGDHIEAWLHEHTDADVTRDDAGDDDRGGNVIARKGSGETTLALVGHHDVVPPDASQIVDDGDDDCDDDTTGDHDGTGYVVEQRDGRLYGRGSADMKGAVAAAMCAFRDATPPADVQLQFVSYVGEEVGGIGCRAAIDRGFVPDYAVVGEGSTGYSAPGVTDVAVAHRGRRGSTVVVEGAAAHASRPEEGDNAIYRAGDAIDVLRGLEFPETEVLGHTVSGSLAVTEIEGGTAWNVIPERCEVTVDERTVPGERAPLSGVEDVEGVTWEIDQDLPPMACDEPAFADAVLAAAREAHERTVPAAREDQGTVPAAREDEGTVPAAREDQGTVPAAREDQGTDEIKPSSTPEQVVKPHATDAGWLADAGTTCVVCGPAERGEPHTEDESVSLAVLDRCYELYRLIAERGPKSRN